MRLRSIREKAFARPTGVMILSDQHFLRSLKLQVKCIASFLLLLSIMSFVSLVIYRSLLMNMKDESENLSFIPSITTSITKKTRRNIYLVDNGEVLWERKQMINHTAELIKNYYDFDVGYATMAPTNNKFVKREESCVPIAGLDADSLSFPTCNSVHEFGFTAEGFVENNNFQEEINQKITNNHNKKIKFLGRGSWRDAWRMGKGSDTLVLKTLRYSRAVDQYAVDKHRIDALVMERLTSSLYVADIFGFCGNSVVNEFGYMGGGKLKKQNLPRRKKLQHAAQAATAVADLHAIVLEGGSKDGGIRRPAALVHMDLKPDNFIINRAKTMKVHDFNLSRFLAKDVVTGELCDLQRNDCGVWRSPEECNYSSHLSEKADIYALGGVIFELLTKQQPFYYDDNKSTQGKGKFPTIPKKYLKSKKPEYKVMVKIIQQCFVVDAGIRPNARDIARKLLDAL